VYPDYRYLPRVQKRKSGASGKDVASAAPSESAPKRKRVKVLTHRPRYIEPATVPEFGGETSSVTEGKKPAITQKVEEPIATPKASSAGTDEPKATDIDEMRVEKTRTLEVISPSAEVTMPKAQKDLSMTPKRKRMVNVLDVLETIKSSSTTPKKSAEKPKTQIKTKPSEDEAAKSQTEAEAEPSEPAKENPWILKKKQKKEL
jgi:hypothetical protein